MNTRDFEEVLGRIRGLLIGMGSQLAPSESAEVVDLLDHAELGEGLRTLAWIVVDESKRLTFAEMAEFRDLAIRMDIVKELPSDFTCLGSLDG